MSYNIGRYQYCARGEGVLNWKGGSEIMVRASLSRVVEESAGGSAEWRQSTGMARATRSRQRFLWNYSKPAGSTLTRRCLAVQWWRADAATRRRRSRRRPPSPPTTRTPDEGRRDADPRCSTQKPTLMGSWRITLVPSPLNDRRGARRSLLLCTGECFFILSFTFRTLVAALSNEHAYDWRMTLSGETLRIVLRFLMLYRLFLCFPMLISLNICNGVMFGKFHLSLTWNYESVGCSFFRWVYSSIDWSYLNPHFGCITSKFY